MLREEGPVKGIFEELQALAQIKFRFKDKEKPQSYVSSLASKLHYFPMEEAISGDFSFTVWSPELITSVLDMLTPDKMRSIFETFKVIFLVLHLKK